MTLRTKEVGQLGERLAEKHFLSLGAELLERNFHGEFCEVDLLFKDEDELVAVEVKTRDADDYVDPRESVRWDQLRRVARGLTTYAAEHNMLEMSHRIDVVLIVIESGGEVVRFEHLKSVFPG